MRVYVWDYYNELENCYNNVKSIEFSEKFIIIKTIDKIGEIHTYHYNNNDYYVEVVNHDR